MADTNDMSKKLGLTEDDQSHLQGYTKYLDTDQREAIKKMMDQRMADQSRAVEIASRGIFQDKSPEEQEFVDKNLNPAMQGLVGGGVMGGIQSVGKAAGPVIQEASSGLKAYLEKMAANQRPGGYAQRLGQTLGGAEKTAAELSGEAGRTLTGTAGGTLEDAAIKQQLANKMRGL